MLGEKITQDLHTPGAVTAWRRYPMYRAATNRPFWKNHLEPAIIQRLADNKVREDSKAGVAQEHWHYCVAVVYPQRSSRAHGSRVAVTVSKMPGIAG